MNFRYFMKEIFAEKTRVYLTLLAILWGTLAIALMLASGEGMMQTVTHYMHDLGANLLVVSGGETSMYHQGQGRNQTIQLTPRDASAVAKLKKVRYVVPEYSGNSTLSYKEKQDPGQRVSGIGGRYEMLRHIKLQTGGRFINQNDVVMKRAVIVLGASVAKSLFPENVDPVGRWVRFAGFDFKVIGVAKDTTQLVNYETANNHLAWIPISTYKGVFSPRGIAHLLVVYRGYASRSLLKRQLRRLLAVRHHVNEKDKTFITIFDNQHILSQTQDFFDAIKVFLGLVGVITLLVAGLGIANVMYVSVQRSMGDIGIRMACGAVPSQIVRQYLLEALLVSFLGGASGLVLTYLIIFIANQFLRHVHFFVIKGLHISLPFSLFFVVLFVLALVGVLAGIFPALRAARIQPVEALRYE